MSKRITIHLTEMEWAEVAAALGSWLEGMPDFEGWRTSKRCMKKMLEARRIHDRELAAEGVRQSMAAALAKGGQ